MIWSESVLTIDTLETTLKLYYFLFIEKYSNKIYYSLYTTYHFNDYQQVTKDTTTALQHKHRASPKTGTVEEGHP